MFVRCGSLVDLGYVCWKKPLAFEISAFDPDDHICQSVTMAPVLNYLEQKTDFTVSVKDDEGNDWGSIPLTSDQAADHVTNRVWKGDWSIPEDAVGKKLTFQYGGVVSDFPCPSHGTSNDDDVNLADYRASLTPFKVESITVIPKGMSESEVPVDVRIAAGAIESDAHQADVTIQTIPAAAGIPVEVSIEKGIGHVKNAKLAMGSTPVQGGGSAVTVNTVAGGKIEGVLTSSDSMDTCTIHACQTAKAVICDWDDVTEPGEWKMDPAYVPESGPLKNWLRLSHHRLAPAAEPSVPLNNHGIRMFVEKLQYWDEQGNLQTIINTPQSPSNVNAWAEFPETPTPTGTNGVVRIDLKVKNPKLHYVRMVAYDWSVYRQPGTPPPPLGMMTLQAAPPSPPADDRTARMSKKDVDGQEFKAVVDLDGVDALTGNEVHETSEDTTGVLIQPNTVTPVAKLILRSVGKPGYQRFLSFSGHAKVTVKDDKGKVLTPDPPDQVIKIDGASEQDVYLTVTQTDATWGLGDSVMATLTVKKGNDTVGSPDKVKLVSVRVKITNIDPRFAPGHTYDDGTKEKLDVKYTIEPAGYAAYAKLEVFAKLDPNTPIFTDDAIPVTGDLKAQWDGKKEGDDLYFGPADSPYTVKVSVSKEANFVPCCYDSKETKIEIHSIDIAPTGGKFIMNDPDHKEAIQAAVYLWSKAIESGPNETSGQAVSPAGRIMVTFSFTDPGDPNTPKNQSHIYAPDKVLGKDNEDVHWAAHANNPGTASANNYKKTCRVPTSTVAGNNRGKAYVWFLPSAVGGDDFKIKASVMGATIDPLIDPVPVLEKQTGAITVWRQVQFDRIYEMAGESHVATAMAGVPALFRDAYMDVVLPANVTPIPANSKWNVKYIGLWKDDDAHFNQQNWAAIKARQDGPTPADKEIYTPEQKAAAAAGDQQAQNEIRAMATHWFNRINGAYQAAKDLWIAGQPLNSINGIQYYHPKYNGPNNEGITAEWSGMDWLKIPINGQDRHPDGLWSGIAGQIADGTITIPKGATPSDTKTVIAHEIGHFASPPTIQRESFGGPGQPDHSTEEGLMDPSGSKDKFEPKELEILRGLRTGTTP